MDQTDAGQKSAAPAGWYPDGESAGLRWWDGQRWTDYRSPSPNAPAAATTPQAAQGRPDVTSVTVDGEQFSFTDDELQVRKPPMSGFTKFLIATPFLIVAAAGLGYLNAQSANDPDRNNNEFAAIMACEDAVGQNLSSPATAEFSSRAVGGGPWTVAGTVDSENAFGALVRSGYECQVLIKGGSASTTITRLDG